MLITSSSALLARFSKFLVHYDLQFGGYEGLLTKSSGFRDSWTSRRTGRFAAQNDKAQGWICTWAYLERFEIDRGLVWPPGYRTDHLALPEVGSCLIRSRDYNTAWDLNQSESREPRGTLLQNRGRRLKTGSLPRHASTRPQSRARLLERDRQEESHLALP